MVGFGQKVQTALLRGTDTSVTEKHWNDSMTQKKGERENLFSGSPAFQIYHQNCSWNFLEHSKLCLAGFSKCFQILLTNQVQRLLNHIIRNSYRDDLTLGTSFLCHSTFYCWENQHTRRKIMDHSFKGLSPCRGHLVLLFWAGDVAQHHGWE
jgi:hypothetical protein